MSNTVRYLHRIALIICCIWSSVGAQAQQNWFVYIQSESNQAFYVRIGETIYNSSSVGHLVINGLHDSTYRLAIGFPQSQYREHQFNVPVHKKDHGFELKKSDARSWVLYEWQSQETIRSPRYDSLLYGARKNDDVFASLMAAVVNDSAVLYASVVKTEPPQKPAKDSSAIVKEAVKKNDSAIAVKDEIKESDSTAVVKDEIRKTNSAPKDSAIAMQEKIHADSVGREELVVKSEATLPDSTLKDSATRSSPGDTNAVVVDSPTTDEEKKPAIAKLDEKTIDNEKKLVFLDNSIGIKKDTVTVIIPMENDSAKPVAKKKPLPSEPAKNSTPQSLMDSVATSKTTDTVKTVKAEMKKIDSPLVEAVKEPEPEKPARLVMVNSDCVKFANEHDVDKLRVKMLQEKDQANRIYVAHKAFKSMCFTTHQVRALSELFSDDENRFRFYETAWPYISDSAQFKSLEGTFTDPFFVTRFRTLLQRQ